ncbi:SRPBCC family protein [Labilithrix luteola]|nr:SRPBCC family protein [Labilithrix luteola]
MLRKVLIGLAVVVALFVVVVATRPAQFHIERSIEIATSPDRPFAQVNDFHAWAAWSPYDKLDPQVTRTFEGPTSGKGAVYGWKGNEKVGEGRMTIEKSTPSSEIGIKLEFTKPFAATNQATFTFAPSASGTKVTWAMDGENNFISKAFALFVDMDKMIGADFEKGLAAMKTVAESNTATTSTTSANEAARVNAHD